MVNTSCAFVGLGAMGYPMAGHLARAGHRVSVYNRTRAKAEAWIESYGGSVADTPAEAARGAGFVFTCVGNDHDLRGVTLGKEGVFAGMDSGAVFVDHTTTSAELARELAGLAEDRGIHCLDAPVSGGEEGAKNGALTIMVGGDPAVFERAEPVMQAYARAVTLMGGTGSGQLTKMVNQICCIGAIQGLAEALNLGMKAGLDMPKVIEVLSKGAAQSWQMDNRALTMVEGKFEGFGFACDWMRKDLDIVLDEARRIGALTPLTAMVEDFLTRLQARGEGRLDNTALIRLLSNP